MSRPDEDMLDYAVDDLEGRTNSLQLSTPLPEKQAPAKEHQMEHEPENQTGQPQEHRTERRRTPTAHLDGPSPAFRPDNPTPPHSPHQRPQQLDTGAAQPQHTARSREEDTQRHRPRRRPSPPPPPAPYHPPHHRRSRPDHHPHQAPTQLGMLRMAQVELLGLVAAEAEASSNPDATLSAMTAGGRRMVAPRSLYGGQNFAPYHRGNRGGRQKQDARRSGKPRWDETRE
ncbi:hypothetical protein JCM1841_000207 [Sporobolomyces salmonicolor]